MDFYDLIWNYDYLQLSIVLELYFLVEEDLLRTCSMLPCILIIIIILYRRHHIYRKIYKDNNNNNERKNKNNYNNQNKQDNKILLGTCNTEKKVKKKRKRSSSLPINLAPSIHSERSFFSSVNTVYVTELWRCVCVYWIENIYCGSSIMPTTIVINQFWWTSSCKVHY